MRENLSLCWCCSTPWGYSISRSTSSSKNHTGMLSSRGSGCEDPVIIHTFSVPAGRDRVRLVISILSILVPSSTKYSKLSSVGTHTHTTQTEKEMRSTSLAKANWLSGEVCSPHVLWLPIGQGVCILLYLAACYTPHPPHTHTLTNPINP